MTTTAIDVANPRIRTIVTHERGDFDEFSALAILRKYGENSIPGIGTAQIEFWRDVPAPLASMSLERLEALGYFPVGILGGRCDEHRPDGTRKPGKCSAVLAAEVAGRAKDPLLARLAGIALGDDTGRDETGKPVDRCGLFEMPKLIKVMADRKGDRAAFAWAEEVFSAIFGAGIGFFEEPIRRIAGKRWDCTMAAWLIARSTSKDCIAIAKTFPDDMTEFEVPESFFAKLAPPDRTESLAINVSKVLCIETDDLALGKLLKFTRQKNQNVGREIFELHALTDLLWSAGVANGRLRNWAFAILDAIMEDGLDFAEVAAGDFGRAEKESITVTTGDGRRITTELVVGRSDSRKFTQYSRWKGAGVVIQVGSEGSVLIQVDENLKLDLVELVKILRVEEQRAANRHDISRKRDIPSNPEWLGALGTMSGCPEWYLFAIEETNSKSVKELKVISIMNSSLTHGAPRTKLDLVQIEKAAAIAFDATHFPPDREKRCSGGLCTSENSWICPLEIYHLKRCMIPRERRDREKK